MALVAGGVVGEDEFWRTHRDALIPPHLAVAQQKRGERRERLALTFVDLCQLACSSGFWRTHGDAFFPPHLAVAQRKRGRLIAAVASSLRFIVAALFESFLAQASSFCCHATTPSHSAAETRWVDRVIGVT